MSKTYLLEIGTEELPAHHIPEALGRLSELFKQALDSKHLSCQSIRTLGTPRRLTVFVEGLPASQKTITRKVKGPPVDKAFDDDGKPTKAGKGFADKNKMGVEELDKEEIDGRMVLVANLEEPGQPTEVVLSDVVPGIIDQISGQRLMRWGDYDFKFSRPIRWLVSLLDDQIVDVTIEELNATNRSYGHRILAPQCVEIGSPKDYESTLESVKVMVDPARRKKIIVEQVEQLARQAGGVASRLSTDLLDEVVFITEWPKALMGSFSRDYLDLPDRLLETIMVHHQRYFPVQKAESNGQSESYKIKNNLLPHFIAVSNNDTESAADKIRQGNERVLRARLADGRFFFFDDQKVKLRDRQDDLRQLTFQHGLGSYFDKQERLVKMAALVSRNLDLDAKISVPLERTMQLCKLDLVTNLVGELPELQGYVGAWYAQQQGEPSEVIEAIASHYAPRHADDPIPPDSTGRLAALLDKLDHVTGLFSLGKRPTGSSDPFALRRNAQGLIDILVDGLCRASETEPAYPIDIDRLINFLLDCFEPMLAGSKAAGKKGFNREKTFKDVSDFLIQRLRGKLLDSGHGKEAVDSIIAFGNPLANVSDMLTRLEALENLIDNEKGLDLVRCGVRVGNILKPDSPANVKETAFSTDTEKALWSKFKSEVEGNLTAQFEPNSLADYQQLLCRLASLNDEIERFFDDVMVNDPDSEKRDLRHAILKNIDRYFKLLADFTKLQPLLN